MGALIMCKIDVTAQDLVLPSVGELSERLEFGALKFGVFHFAAPAIILGIGVGSSQSQSQSLIGDNDFTPADDRGVGWSLEAGVSGRLNEGPLDLWTGEYDAAFDLADERDDWIQGGTLLEQIMGAAVEQEEI
jgi:hypothetical protein